MTFPFVYKHLDERPAEVVSDPEILGGMPCVRGTRVPAETIVAYIRGGASLSEIFNDYPTLPNDGVEAVKRWAIENGISLEPE
jgi:uncharacterized protein (DUF433 family)